MRVLGISCDFHDAAAAVVVDGDVVAAAEQERFSRIKHDPALPSEAIASVLAIAGLGPDDVDRVVFHEKPLVTVARVLAARQSQGPRSFGTFTRELPVLLRRNLFVGLRIERALRDLGATRRPSLRYAEHHLSHAAAAFYPSPFASAAVLTVDGIGEWATASIGRGTGTALDLLTEQRYPDSLGLFYSLMTEFCGFRPNDGEYKLMGLAPYGEPTQVDALREVIEVHPDGSVTIDPWLTRSWADGARALEKVLGRPALERDGVVGPGEADLARSVQVLLEDAVLAMARHAHELTGERSLCLAGGVALNCVANGRLQREGPFDDVWVQPAAGDAGSAIGAALWLSHAEEGVARPVPRSGDGMHGALLGPAMPADAVGAWLDASSVPHERVTDRAARAATVAAALDDGAFVGWFEGAMEFGPRALGHRSILADPRSATAQRDLNVRVKDRESFRPFAPAVLEEHASGWFEIEQPSPYMLFTYQVAPERRDGPVVDPTGTSLTPAHEVRSAIPACTHVDYSARVQTIGADRDDGFRALAEAFNDRTGCPVLLNTSFNGAGEPVVCTPDDAVATARRIGLDLLVIEDSLIPVADLPEQVAAGKWAQAPAPTVVQRPMSNLALGAAVAIVAMLGPAVRVAAVTGIWAGIATGAVAGVAAFGLHAIGADRWWGRIGILCAAATTAMVLGGTHVGLWVLVALVAVDMVAFGHRLVPPVPAGDRHVLPALVAISVVMTWLSRRFGGESGLRILMVGIVVIVAVSAFFPGRLASVTARFAQAVGSVVATAGAAIMWVIAVLVPWVVHQLVRIDPLRPGGQTAGTAWVRRDGGGTRPNELWRRDATSNGPPLGWRVRRTAGTFLVVGLLGFAVVPVVLAERRDRAAAPAVAGHSNTDPNAIPAALADDEWYPDYQQDISWLWRTSIAWDPLAPVRLRDVNTRYINIVDGARKSWQPPACDCRRIRVWMYGGSTAFGLGQRDEYTIASEVARAAWEDGIAVDIDNRGVVGDHHWEEANRFAWDLATLPAPDVVVFLDGINDVQAVDRQKEETRQPLSFIKDDFWRNYLSVAGDAMDPRWAPDAGDAGAPEGASVPTTLPLSFDEAAAAGEFVASRYETARKISAASAQQAGVIPAWFWQPAIENRPEIEGEPPPSGREWSLERYRSAAANLGAEVHDISGALDGFDEPLYWDQFHTNELGAAGVGDAIYAELRTQLEQLSSGGS